MPYAEIDHTADVMFHVWGDTLAGIFVDSITAMTSVMLGSACTAEGGIENAERYNMEWLRMRRRKRLWKILESLTETRNLSRKMGQISLEDKAEDSTEDFFCNRFTLKAATLKSLLFQILDEYLYVWSGENMCCIRTAVTHVETNDPSATAIDCTLFCVPISSLEECSGIEVKAVTLHNLRVDSPRNGALQEKPANAHENRWNAFFVLDI